ncbi:hypothetical protein A3Q56_01811 [Intoshia linei]|uniref:Methionine aminopeptidase n=1 Tax=Intoshia linei TaxID=1819745 RepID=A0A177B9X0_9BILA|nr:hypothetical protein A3Q56_01811 [Intoshia linei]
MENEELEFISKEEFNITGMSDLGSATPPTLIDLDDSMMAPEHIQIDTTIGNYKQNPKVDTSYRRNIEQKTPQDEESIETFKKSQLGLKDLTERIMELERTKETYQKAIIYCKKNVILFKLLKLMIESQESLIGVKSTICIGFHCNKKATLQCPICLKMKLPVAKFCGQQCFKSNWIQHKILHTNVDVFKNYQFSGSLRPSVRRTALRKVPDSILETAPVYAKRKDGMDLVEEKAKGGPIRILNETEIGKMKIVGRLARAVLDAGLKAAKVGVTTEEIDKVVHEKSIELNCYPSPLNYYNFPASVCTSVNEVICHGIPDARALVDGDLLNIDVTVHYDGFHGDLNETILIGDKYSSKTDDKFLNRGRNLVETTYKCISAAIGIVKPGAKFCDIGKTIEKIANLKGFSVVKSYCGHGIHSLFHAPPNIAHFANNKPGIIKAGMCFTIEPMINEGSHYDNIWPDDWTAVTADGKRSAQFEQTLLVTETGCEILTLRQENNGKPHFMDSDYYKY